MTDADDIMGMDGRPMDSRSSLKLNPNETVNFTFSAKIERFIETIGKKVKTANSEVEIRKMPEISRDNSEWPHWLLLQSRTWVVYSEPHGTLSENLW